MKSQSKRGRKKQAVVRKPVTVWLFPEQIEKLDSMVEKYHIDSRSKVIETLMFRKKPAFYGKEYLQLTAQIGKIGININQIARSFNMMAKSDLNEDRQGHLLKELFKQLGVIQQILRDERG
ncbi:MAG: plasmid mobilization relaxosome protein MobC [Cyclobacteriaceae bacterium]